jgi:hypothetical protein
MKSMLNIIGVASIALLSCAAHVTPLHAEDTPQKYIIGYWYRTYPDGRKDIPGFFSAFFSVLAHAAWANRNHKLPVVYWEDFSPYSDGYGNAWEYYFEPLSDERYDNTLDPKPSTEYCAPDNTGVRPWSRHSQPVKEMVHRVIERYIIIKKPILDKIDAFYQKYMADKITIGVHLRGTDKDSEVIMPSAEEIIAVANQIGKLIPNCQFFVATDEESLLTLAREKLNRPVIAYIDSYRSLDGQPIHKTKSAWNNAKKGEDVLIEAKLLSMCGMLVYSHSNVGYAATFFNPSMIEILVEGRP